MKRFLISLICGLFSLGGLNAETALEVLERFNKNNIRNKEEKDQIINTINGNNKGLNNNKKLTHQGVRTVVNAAWKPVMVNGAYYDWFDILKASLDQKYQLNTGVDLKAKYERGDVSDAYTVNTALQKFLYSKFGELWFSADISHAFEDDKKNNLRDAQRYVVHQVCYYIINRFIQNNEFKAAVHLSEEDLAKDIYQKLKDYKFTTFYTDLGKIEAIAQIKKYGQHILTLVSDQKSPLDHTGIKVEGKVDEYIDIHTIHDVVKRNNVSSYINAKDENASGFLNSGEICRVAFNKQNKVIGIDDPYQVTGTPILVRDDKSLTKFVTYKVPTALENLTGNWGMVASPLNIEKGNERLLYLFWVSCEEDSTIVRKETGVVYGYLDVNFLPKGGKGAARVGRLIQISKMPTLTKEGKDLIENRRNELEDTINNWHSNLYPLQLFSSAFSGKDVSSGEKTSIVGAYEIFSRLSALDPKTQPWFILCEKASDGTNFLFSGFPNFKIEKTQAVKTGIDTLEVEKLTIERVDTLKKTKTFVNPTYFTSSMAQQHFNANKDRKDFKSYLIEDNSKEGNFFYISANQHLFTPKILYCTYRDDKGKLVLFQASAGIPTPQMLLTLYTLKHVLKAEWSEEENYKSLDIPQFLYALYPYKFPKEESPTGFDPRMLQEKLNKAEEFKKTFGLA